MQPRIAQAQVAVHGMTHIGGVGVFLTVVFPPADRAESQGGRGFQGLEAAAGAAVKGLYGVHV